MLYQTGNLASLTVAGYHPRDDAPKVTGYVLVSVAHYGNTQTQYLYSKEGRNK